MKKTLIVKMLLLIGFGRIEKAGKLIILVFIAGPPRGMMPPGMRGMPMGRGMPQGMRGPPPGMMMMRGLFHRF